MPVPIPASITFLIPENNIFDMISLARGIFANVRTKLPKFDS